MPSHAFQSAKRKEALITAIKVGFGTRCGAGGNDRPAPTGREQSLKTEERPSKLPLGHESWSCLSLQVVMTEVGFSHDRPVAACVIFKSLLHWHSFEAERTNVFDRIIQNMGLAIDGNQENNEILAYWLSNTATLLSLLQRTLKASASSGATKKKQLNVSLMGRLTQVRCAGVVVASWLHMSFGTQGLTYVVVAHYSRRILQSSRVVPRALKKSSHSVELLFSSPGLPDGDRLRPRPERQSQFRQWRVAC